MSVEPPEVACTFLRRIPPYENVPLGYDRHGSEYWLLGAQDIELLVDIGRDIGKEQPHLSNPAVLVRLVSGWWGRYAGEDLTSLINCFSMEYPCEQDLRSRLIARLYEAQNALNGGHFAMARIHSEWFENQRKLDRWLTAAEANIQDCVNVTEEMHQVETMLARSMENRLNLLTALLTKNEAPDIVDAPPPSSTRLERDFLRKKRLRDLQMEEWMELHPVKGWLRLDLFAEMKMLYVTTSATRLLADPTIHILHGMFTRKSAMRRSQVPIPESPKEDVLITAESKEDEDNDFEVAEEEQLVDGGTSQIHGSNQQRPVEQLDPSTGAILRRYSSGSEAAAAMQMSPTAISQCADGRRSEVHNFKWRWYSGPSIDCKRHLFYHWLIYNNS